MFSPLSRRKFLGTTLQAGALAGLGDFLFLKGLPPVAADDVKATPKVVRLSPDVEPLVRLLEDTDRAKLLEVVADKIRAGASYQQLLGAALLAGVRCIKPRPVGFQFHAVLVIHSAHLASLAATDNDRWLPLFWALDNFKASQATNLKQNAGWVMPPVNEAKLPAPSEARKRFVEAMDDWDEEGADAAVAALARTATPGEVIELFWRYGARDFRDIGHKAIFVANSWRALQTVGWQNAEPVLRSLAFALLQHEGDNPAKRDAEADRPWRENRKRVAEFGAGWRDGKPSADAARAVLETQRAATPDEACAKIVELVKKGVHPSSLWDGLFLTAGELIMRQPGIVGIHCVTSANALHQAYQNTADDDTRRMVLLQAAADLALFRKTMAARDKMTDARLDKLEPEGEQREPAAAVEEIFTDVGKGKDCTKAARKTLALVGRDPASVDALMKAARRLIFSKGRDSHDYKFSSAALEDYRAVSPRWRPHYLAASMFNLRGSADPDNGLIRRTRAALEKS